MGLVPVPPGHSHAINAFSPFPFHRCWKQSPNEKLSRKNCSYFKLFACIFAKQTAKNTRLSRNEQKVATFFSAFSVMKSCTCTMYTSSNHRGGRTRASTRTLTSYVIYFHSGFVRKFCRLWAYCPTTSFLLWVCYFTKCWSVFPSSFKPVLR